jgi:hypothetical protein
MKFKTSQEEFWVGPFGDEYIDRNQSSRHIAANTSLFSKIIQRSSNIRSIGYDQKTQTLEVEFLKGGVYQYFDVPWGTWLGFVAADSKGKYFIAQIRDSYRYSRV